MHVFKNMHSIQPLSSSHLYQIESLGDDDDGEPSFKSDSFQEDKLVYFHPRGLKNFALVDEMETLNPILDCKVLNLGNEETPQFYTLCGRGDKSSIKVLRHGLEVSEMAVSELPAGATATWTVKGNVSDEYDKYIVVSFANATIVLAVGETVEEIQDSGFIGTVPSIHVGQLGLDSFIQIHQKGIRYIKSNKKIIEWKAPQNKPVKLAACNGKQVVLALGSSELVYFELDETGLLSEHQERKTLSSEIVSLSIGKIQEGRQRSRYLAVGSTDATVRMFSLDPQDCLQPLSMQALSSKPTSLLLTEMSNFASDGHLASLYLVIGLENGVLVKLTVDGITGMLSDARTRFLGPKPIKLFAVNVEGSIAVLALSTRPWLQYVYQNRSYLTPMFYESLEYASSFASEPCPNGIVAVTGNSLRYTAIFPLLSSQMLILWIILES